MGMWLVIKSRLIKFKIVCLTLGDGYASRAAAHIILNNARLRSDSDDEQRKVTIYPIRLPVQAHKFTNWQVILIDFKYVMGYGMLVVF